MLLKLAGFIGVESLVAAVVRSRSQFIHDDPSVLHEHLYSEEADEADLLGDAERQGTRLGGGGFGDTGWRNREVQDVVPMDIFGRVVDCGATINRTRHKYRNLHLERHPRFKYPYGATNLIPRCREIRLGGRQLDLTFAIITEIRGLQYTGETDGLHG